MNPHITLGIAAGLEYLSHSEILSKNAPWWVQVGIGFLALVFGVATDWSKLGKAPAPVVPVLVLALLSLAACKTVPQPVVNVGRCVSSDLAPKIAADIALVENALASDQWQQMLITLGGQVGYDVVDCTVQEVIAQARAQHTAAPTDVLSAAQVAHGTAWLAR